MTNSIEKAVSLKKTFEQISAEVHENWNECVPNMEQLKAQFEGFETYKDNIEEAKIFYRMFGFMLARVKANHMLCESLSKEIHDYLGKHPELKDEDKAILRKLRENCGYMAARLKNCCIDLEPYVTILAPVAKKLEEVDGKVLENIDDSLTKQNASEMKKAIEQLTDQVKDLDISENKE